MLFSDLKNCPAYSKLQDWLQQKKTPGIYFKLILKFTHGINSNSAVKLISV
jgi:hypothetical protein